MKKVVVHVSETGEIIIPPSTAKIENAKFGLLLDPRIKVAAEIYWQFTPTSQEEMRAFLIKIMKKAADFLAAGGVQREDFQQ